MSRREKDTRIAHAAAAPRNTLMQPLHNDLQPESQQAHRIYAHMNNHSLQHTEAEPIRRWNDRTRNRRTQELPFTAEWKKQGFVANRRHFPRNA